MSDGLDDVPALLFGRGDEGADVGKVGCCVQASEASGDFLFDLHHTHITFGLIVGEGHGWIFEEAQDVLLAGGEAHEKIVAGSARLATTRFGISFAGGGRERRLGFVECQAFGDDGVITPLKPCQQARLERVESDAEVFSKCALCGELAA